MERIGLVRWEGIDDFRPPKKHRYKHIPDRETKTFDLATASRLNNALLALHPQTTKFSERDTMGRVQHEREYQLGLLLVPKSVREIATM